jgi:hypothetical protein
MLTSGFFVSNSLLSRVYMNGIPGVIHELIIIMRGGFGDDFERSFQPVKS